VNLRRWTMIVIFIALTLAIAGCAATVSQEDYDQVVSDLDAALDEVTTLEDEVAAGQSQVADLEAQVADLETQVSDLEGEITGAQELAGAAEEGLADLQERVNKAAISAEIMDVFLQVGFGGGDLTEEDAMGVFLELSEKVEASGDEGLQEKFQAVLFSFGGEQEALDLVEYMLGTMSSLGE
jgi:outer membrane murein-binding lipoprotein Lpp